jgi:hypothetical protein
MTRDSRRKQVDALVVSRLDMGEELLGTSVVWAARLGRTPILFTGRHLHVLALTDRRLFVFERRARRRRDTEPVVAESLDQVTLERARSLLTWFQVILRVSDGRRLVFEFRFRNRATGHALVRTLHASPRA